MPKVNNWQLGREMEYPYEAASPERQFAFVININRCIGCQTCTMACKSTWTFSKGQEAHVVDQRRDQALRRLPDQHWDVKMLEKLEGANPGGQSPGEPWSRRARAVRPVRREDVFEFEARPRRTSLNRVLGYLPEDRSGRRRTSTRTARLGGRRTPDGLRLSRRGLRRLPKSTRRGSSTWRGCATTVQLSRPASPPARAKAIYKRPEDGIVLIDQKRCRGYRKCVEACPYKKSLYRPTTRACPRSASRATRVEGKDPEADRAYRMETRCMAACIGQVRMQGTGEDGSPNGDVGRRSGTTRFTT